MTIEEYNEAKEKVKQFKTLQDKKENYEFQKSRVELGILSITTAYQNQIGLATEDKLKEKVKSAIVSVYDDEIADLEKEMSDIQL